MWHGLELPWLAWAILNCFGLFVEAGVKIYISKSSFWRPYTTKWYWQHVECAGYALNIVGLILANLAISHGFEHTYYFVKFMFTNEGAWWAIPYLLLVLWCNGHMQNTLQELQAEKAKLEEKQNPTQHPA